MIYAIAASWFAAGLTTMAVYCSLKAIVRRKP